MRIGISAGGSSAERIVENVRAAEADGFPSVWFPSRVMGDPLPAMAVAGHATTTVELGTSVLQTFPCHPVLMANRAAATARTIGRPGFLLGIGPSHEMSVRALGYSYDRPGQYTEEYVTVLTTLLRGEPVDFHGELIDAEAPGIVADVPVLLAALAPRHLRVAGTMAAGTVTWMANARAIETHVQPRISRAAARAGRPAPRIVVGAPCAVHDDLDEARQACQVTFGRYNDLPNYRRLMDIGGTPTPADASLLGDEAAVTAQITALFDAGATDVWCDVFPVGDDRVASRARTQALLASLL